MFALGPHPSQPRPAGFLRRRPAASGGVVNTFFSTPSPPCRRRRDAASSGASTSARCPSAHRPTRSRAARPALVTSTITTRRSLTGAERLRPAALHERGNRIGHRRRADAAQDGQFGEGARLLVEHHQQREVRGRRQLAREAELRGHGPHDERHDFEELARGFARLITCHRWRLPAEASAPSCPAGPASARPGGDVSIAVTCC